MRIMGLPVSLIVCPLHPMVVGTLNCNILVGGETGGETGSETGGETGSETGGLVVGTCVTPCLPPLHPMVGGDIKL